MRRLFTWLLRLFPADFRGDFGSEMQEVFDEELTEAGSPRRQARAWRRTLGGMLRTGPSLHLEQLWQDTRYAGRNLRRSPAFTVIAVAALAFGIGSSVSTFGLADAFLLRPLPFAQPDQLVHIWAAERARGYDQLRASWQEAESWAGRNDVFSGVAVFNYTSVELTSGPEPERVPSGLVGPNLFEVLGVPPLLGRTFRTEDTWVGADPVVMLSEDMWRTRLQATPDVIGSGIDIAGVRHTVVGVMPAAFVFPLPITELWTPRRLDPAVYTADVQPFQVVARLREGVTRHQAGAAINAAAADLVRTYPSLDGRTANVTTLRSALNFIDDILSVGLVVVAVANLLVLLTACANVSSLMLGRAVRRGREVAIRAAIGASRFRLVRQFLVESLVLALIGGLGGVVIAMWSLRLAGGLIPMELYRVGTLAVDWRAFAVTTALAGGCAVVFGLTPALRFARVNLGGAMRQDGGAGTLSRSSLRLQSLQVQAQIGLSVVLLVGTVLVARSFGAMADVDPGFQSAQVVSFDLVLPSERHADRAAVARFHADVRQRAAAVPGVAAASTVNYLPLNNEYSTARVLPPGIEVTPAQPAPEAVSFSVGPDYFSVLGIPVQQGREFTAADTGDRPPVAIISASFAERYWPTASAVGGIVRLLPSGTALTVVGVVADTRQIALAEAPRDLLFVPQAQSPWTYHRLIVRTERDPAAVVPDVTAAIHAIDPLLPVVEVRTLDAVLDQALLPYRSLSYTLSAMGGFALALALLGIYGIVMVYVVDRTRELGIRVALGADEGRIVRFVMGRGLRLALIGGGVGLVLSVAASLALRGVLFGVGAGDPLTYAFVVTLVVGVAAIAGLLPARRAARISPILAMKE